MLPDYRNLNNESKLALAKFGVTKDGYESATQTMYEDIWSVLNASQKTILFKLCRLNDEFVIETYGIPGN